VFVEELGAQGDGLAPWAGQTLYIPATLPNERVRVKTGAKRSDGLGCTLLEVVQPAPERIPPICEYYAQCGGCALQHVDETFYAQWKRARVTEVLAKRGFADVAVLDPVLIKAGTRRRVTFTVQHRGKRLDLGFNARASHDIVAIERCPLLAPSLNAMIAPLGELMRHVLADGERARVVLTACDNGTDMVIEADKHPDLAAREAIAAFAGRGHAARVSWKEPDFPAEPVAQVHMPKIDLSGVSVDLPMGAFLQASIEGERAILAQILVGVGNAARIADLYCGVGSFTLALARQAIVRAIDSLETPVRALERAAGRTNLGGRVLAEVRDLDRQPLDPAELNKFDAIVFDPPRAGAAAQAAQIAQSDVPKVVAVSCNPATFARDARILVNGGYRLIDVLPVDQFTFSAHVELVARFEREIP
jgi:23S rRNA (uracil1939-C5)-methyltransferase